jgi:hypothetical protein
MGPARVETVAAVLLVEILTLRPTLGPGLSSPAPR